jgi:hypothetical protein
VIEIPFRERSAPQLVRGGALDQPVSSVPQ